MPRRRIHPPSEYKFVVHTDGDGSKEVDRQTLTFSVVEKDISESTRMMVVLPRLPQRSGCMTLMFDPRPIGDDRTVVIESVKHDTNCAAEGLPRKYGTRAMILGTLNFLREIARERYPHLQEIELADEASYPCPPFAVEEDGNIKTFATDLLLSGTTYYERHLNVTPCKNSVLKSVNAVKRRVAEPVDLTFDTFWAKLTGDDGVENDTERTADQLRWLSDKKGSVRKVFERHGSTSWRVFFQNVHKKHGCVFFSCCWWRLCIVFDMTRLVGAAWVVSFGNLPQQQFTVVDDDDNDTRVGGGSGLRTAAYHRGIARKVQKEIDEVFDRKRRGRWARRTKT